MTKHPVPADVGSSATQDSAPLGTSVRTLAVRVLLFVTPVMLGVAAVVLLWATNAGPQRAVLGETPTPVRTIRIGTGSVVPRCITTGVVRAPTSWSAVARVSGEIEYRSSKAEVGRFVEAGEVLLRIDQREYEIAVRRIQAATAETNARMENLDGQEASMRRLVEIDRESLELLEANYGRVRESFGRGAASPGEVDDARREYLSQLARVTDLERLLNAYPSDRAALEATLKANQADLENAQLALSRTEVAAPFAGRVTEVVAEEAEFVSIGQRLLTIADVSRAELIVNVAPSELRHVVTPPRGGGSEVGVQALRALLEERVVAAVVRLPHVEPSVTWVGSIDRVGASLEPSTRTLAIYVLVEDPYGQFSPGMRPPLVEEMFCEVELRAEAIADRSLIPRVAYHDGLVHLVRDDRLVRQRVDDLFHVGDYIAVRGLDEGAAVVVSDLPFVLEGMLLSASIDEALEGRIATIASGEGRLR